MELATRWGHEQEMFRWLNLANLKKGSAANCGALQDVRHAGIFMGPDQVKKPTPLPWQYEQERRSWNVDMGFTGGLSCYIAGNRVNPRDLRCPHGQKQRSHQCWSDFGYLVLPFPVGRIWCIKLGFENTTKKYYGSKAWMDCCETHGMHQWEEKKKTKPAIFWGNTIKKSEVFYLDHSCAEISWDTLKQVKDEVLSAACLILPGGKKKGLVSGKP